MFTLDVVALRQFYASPLGRQAARCILAALRRLWPDCKGDGIAALGYALPYLDALRHDAGLAVPLMLGSQGAVYWPAEGDNRTVLTRGSALPLQGGGFNRALVAHALEHSRHADDMIGELRRILTPGGRALLIVPNRIGVWAHAVSTPFGHGHPYSVMQLSRRLTEGGFTVTDWTTALYPPPLSWRWLLKAVPALEFLGRLLVPGGGGVILMEVEKQIYAAIPEPARTLAESLLPVRVPAATARGVP